MGKVKLFLLSLIMTFGIFLSFNPVGYAQDKTISIQVKDGQDNQLMLEVTNNGKQSLEKIKGTTIVPTKLKEDFETSDLNWELDSLEASKTEKLYFQKKGPATGEQQLVNETNQKNNKKQSIIPQLGEKTQKVILQVMGVILLTLMIFLLYKKKQSSLLLLVLIFNLFGSNVVQAVEDNIESKYLAKNGETYLFKTKLSYSVKKESEVTEKDQEIRISGTAKDNTGNLLKNSLLIFENEASHIEVETNQDGYFFTHINQNQDYAVTSHEKLKSSVMIREMLDYTVTNEVGTLDLGRKIVNPENEEAYVKLGVNSIYLDPSEAKLLTDGSVEVLKTGFEQGDIIVVDASADHPNGYLLKVENVKIMADKTILTGSEPSLGTVFEEIHTPTTGPVFNEPEVTFNEALDWEQAPKRRRHRAMMAPRAMDATQNEFKKMAKFKWPKEEDSHASLGIEPTISGEVGVTGVFTMDYAPMKNKQNVEFYVSPYTKIDLGLHGKGVLQKEWDHELMRVKVPTSVPLITLNIPISFNVNPKVEATIGMSTEFKVEPKLGFRADENGFENLSGINKDIFSINGAELNGKASLDATLKAEPNLYAGEKNQYFSLGATLVEVSGGLGGGVSSEFGKTPTSITKAESRIDAKTNVTITPFKELTDLFEKAGFTTETGLESTMNLFKTGQLSVNRDVAEANGNQEIEVRKGETVVLKVLNNEGQPVTPKTLFLSDHQTATLDKATMELKIKEDAKVGDSFEITMLDFDQPVWFKNAQKVKVKVTNLTSGSLEGLITEALNDMPIEKAHLVFFNEKNEKSAETITDEKGNYKVDLSAGKYTAEVTAKGYITDKKYNIFINKNQTKYNAKLKLVGLDYSDVGEVSGIIRNDVSGEGIKEATLVFRRGSDNREGEVITKTLTDSYGNYEANLPGGNYTIEMIKKSFVTGYADIISLGKRGNTDQNGSMTPDFTNSEKVRIVLTWGANPRDLDSHLTGEKADGNGRFHIFYQYQQFKDSENNVNLDVDDRFSYGPETVTILDKLNNGTYTYAVHKYAGESEIHLSDALVKVYIDNQLVNTFAAPNQEGNLWKVFELKDGQVVPVNQMATTDNTSPNTDELLPQSN